MLTLRIYESVRHKILSGSLAPGTRLIIRKLALEHGTSDIPIREALRMLVRDGLVEMIPYRGARVVELSSADIEEGYLIRGHLESLATRTAVGHVTADHFKQIDRCMRDMEQAIEAADSLRYAELNREFHAIIFSASPHRRLQDLINNIWDGQGVTRWCSACPSSDCERPIRTISRSCGRCGTATRRSRRRSRCGTSSRPARR